jgi:hypothetical protein
MKIRPAILGIVASLPLLLSFFSSASAMDDPGFTIKRMVMSEKIVDKEPVAPTANFSANTETVYCFLEANAIETDTTVSFVWFYENKEMARVTVPLVKGKRWRTYSSKKLSGLKGSWKVELLESSGIILNTVTFQVQ